MSNPAIANILEFMHKTAEDEALRSQLEQLLGVGDGNISSQAELDPEEAAVLKGTQAPKVAEFASTQGFSFTAADLVMVIEAFEKHQAGTMSDAEFSKLLGESVPGHGDKDHKTQVTNPLKRLSQYLGKTYLGLGATSEEE